MAARKLDVTVDTVAKTVTVAVPGVKKPAIKLGLSELAKGLVEQSALHGVKQKLSDSAAGKSGSAAYESIRAVADRLRAGQWNAPRAEGTGSAQSRASLEAWRETLASAYNEKRADAIMADKERFAKARKVARLRIAYLERYAAKLRKLGLEEKLPDL